MKCENCNQYDVFIRSYREVCGTIHTFPSCKYCHNLNNEYFFKVREDKNLDPKRILYECEGKDCNSCKYKLKCITGSFE